MNAKTTYVPIDTYCTLVNGEQILTPVFRSESEKAVCYEIGGRKVWIPRKCIVNQGTAELTFWIEIPFWLAKEKGIVMSLYCTQMVG